MNAKFFSTASAQAYLTRVKMLFLLGLALGLTGCGPEKQGFVADKYHNTTSFFNGFYHARLSYEQGLAKIDEAREIPTDGFMPLMAHSEGGGAQSGIAYFDSSIKKCDVIIYKHPHSDWVDDSRFLNGRCYFYKGDYSRAIQNFQYVLHAFPESDLRPAVKLWLGKAYYITGNKFRAKETLKELAPNGEMEDKTRVQITEMKVTIMIENEQYNQAVSLMEDNLEYVSDRKRKARWNFLMGQLYEENSSPSAFPMAFSHYEETAKLNVSDEMTFRAKLAIANLYTRNQAPSDQQLINVRAMLNELLNDVKYEQYRDQVHYTLARIERSEGQLDSAIVHLKKSLNVGSGNQRQKVKSYYMAGRIYFYEKQDFVNAQAYFDSAAQVADPQMPEYEEIQSMSQTLGRYIHYRNMVQEKDSLLALSEMPEDKLRKHAEKAIKAEEERKRKAREARRRREREMRQRMQQNARYGQGNDPFGGGNKGFYFDNQSKVARGKQQFQQRWGRRNNEDHWRRSNKQQVARAPEEQEQEKKDTALSMEEKVDRYVANVPRKDSTIQAFNDSIEVALFQLGQMYYKQFNLPDSALPYLRREVSRYPDGELTPKAYYTIFRIQKEQKREDKADKIGNVIVDRFPKTIYAKLVKGVSAQEGSSDQTSFTSALQTLRSLYESRDYATALNFANFSTDQFLDHPDVAKMFYIKGLVYSEMDQEDSLRSTYKYLTRNFPEHETAPIAQMTLDLLDGKPIASEATGEPAQKEAPASQEWEPKGVPPGVDLNKDAYSGFELKQRENDPIFAVLLVDKDRIKRSKLSIRLSDFNKKKFSQEKLRASILTYKTDSVEKHLAYIVRFDDYFAADAYVKRLKNQGNLVSLLANPKTDAMFISAANFRVAFQMKRFNDYADFFVTLREALKKSNPPDGK